MGVMDDPSRNLAVPEKLWNATRARAAEQEARIAELEHAARSAADILHMLSMATDGSLRGSICSASNVLDHALGRQQSMHGKRVETADDNRRPVKSG
jgi:hypothetical protein